MVPQTDMVTRVWYRKTPWDIQNIRTDMVSLELWDIQMTCPNITLSLHWDASQLGMSLGQPRLNGSRTENSSHTQNKTLSHTGISRPVQEHGFPSWT